MKRTKWKTTIEEATKAAGTYKPYFEPIIDTLASILEKRDEAEARYEESGEGPVITYTNKAKESNKVKNPALVVIMDLNTQALAYWRDLGLTPSGLKKINETAIKPKGKESTLESVLKSFGK